MLGQLSNKADDRSAQFLWLSLIIHLMIFLAILYYYFFPEPLPVQKKDETYYYFVPAQIASAVAPMTAGSASASPKPAKPLPTVAPDYDLSLTKMNRAYQEIMKNPNSFAELGQNQRMQMSADNQYLEPIRLVGEKLLDDPFRKLLGRAITGKLYYPEIARNLQLRGRVSIGFVLHPDGAITDAHIIKTSREKSLDMAALDAVTRASPINNVDLYLKQAEYLVVNIIF